MSTMIPTLAAALADKGYDTLTPVQIAVADPDLGQADLLVSAQTGSGKTVGFGLAIGATILDAEGKLGPAGLPIALVIAPTRELALQVRRELQWLYAGAGVVMAQTVGGMDMRDERRALERGAHIVVATPGRLKDHILRGSLDMSAMRAIVLDEADEMLDLGFREDLEFILAKAPADRRTLMFSATVPPMIARLAESYLRDPVRIATTSKESQHADIDYRAMAVANHDADNAIINVLRYFEAPNAIIFANTRAMVTRLTTRLSNRGFAVVALSGELSQAERSHALQAMRDGRARVCVATDVAARGIDLPNLELVIHAELPTNAETLMHRSGRTGRAGRKGISALIVPPKMRKRAENLLKWGKLRATWTVPPTADEVQAQDEARLLTDEVWTAEFTEAETAFARKLLDTHSPEQIAAAYLRLYQGRQSAPEDLTVVDPSAPVDTAPRERKERAPFGPSRWFSVDVGRDGKAEARWLLPMICKAGDITKNEIGAIRIQPDETFVEIAATAVAGFLTAVGPEMRLENQATLTALDGPPQISARGPRPDKRDYQKPARPAKTDRPERTPRAAEDRPPVQSAPVAHTPKAAIPGAADDPEAKKPRRAKSGDARPRPPRDDSPAKPGRPPRHDDGKPAQDRPSKAGKPRDKDDRPPFAKHPRKPDGKPGRPGGKDGFKPHAKGPGKGRPKDSDAPRSKAAGPAPVKASDTSKRFVPPGAKPSKGGKRANPGAGPPRRTPPKSGR